MKTILLILTVFSLQAEIMEIYSFKEIETVDEKTLIVLDIDQTLLFAKDPYFQSPSFLEKKDELRTFMKEWTPEKKKICKHLIGMSLETQLVEEGWDKQIEAWQEKGIPVIALTAATAEIPGALDMRSNQLKAARIDLSKTAPDLNHIPFPHKNGIIMTGEGSLKADVIASFKEFDKVIMVDDQQNYLEWMKDAHPGFRGYHYRLIEITKVHPLEDQTLFEKWGAIEKKTDEVLKEIMLESPL